MQTFLPYPNSYSSAIVLDNRRLGKQRVEALQIAECLLVKESHWKNHPAVLMWKDYVPYLVRVYIPAIMGEWLGRGYNNTKCGEKWVNLSAIVFNEKIMKPHWLNEDFCIRHQSNLLRKDKNYYGPLFPNVPDNLEYIWPIRKGVEYENY